MAEEGVHVSLAMSLRRETEAQRRSSNARTTRRDQWTCAGVSRHHGDLLATSRNKMATLSRSIAKRWRQSHVRQLLIPFVNCLRLMRSKRWRNFLLERSALLSGPGAVQRSHRAAPSRVGGTVTMTISIGVW